MVLVAIAFLGIGGDGEALMQGLVRMLREVFERGLDGIARRCCRLCESRRRE